MDAAFVDAAVPMSHVACQTPDDVNEPSFQSVAIVGVSAATSYGALPAHRFAFGVCVVGALLHPHRVFADAAPCRLPRTVDHVGNVPDDVIGDRRGHSQPGKRGCLCPFRRRLWRTPLAIRASVDVIGEFRAARRCSGRSAQSVGTGASSAADSGRRSESGRQPGHATDGCAEPGKRSEFDATGRPGQQSLVAVARTATGQIVDGKGVSS